MTIIVFLVDTSASMNQCARSGMTLLDTAKHSIEIFLKIRSRDPACRLDRYMLLTFEDPPMNVKAGWRENHCTFVKELKSLQASGLSNLESALKNAFDLLNVNRLQTGIDTFGQGRFPFYIEPAVIICLTDGNITSSSTEIGGLNMPVSTSLLGSELTKEPFRWDHRLFSIVYKMEFLEPPEACSSLPRAEDCPIDSICEATGGRSYAITTQKSLLPCLESLAQKLQSGVIFNFAKLPSESSDGVEDSDGQPWQSCKQVLFINRSAQKGVTIGYWPIPENYWPDAGKETLPPRPAHPQVNFSCRHCDPLTMESIPFDKYELEPSPLTQYILEGKQSNKAWQVFMKNSSKHSELGHPFGYLKASTNFTAVNLFVMPYNYPLLFSLLNDLAKVHKFEVTPKWRMQFEGYLNSVPPYYALPLKKALGRLSMLPNSINLIPDQMENCFSYSVVSHLKKVKNQAKSSFEQLVASIGQTPSRPTIRVVPHFSINSIKPAETEKLMAHYTGDIYGLHKELALPLDAHKNFILHIETNESHVYKNRFDSKRSDLVMNLSKIRLNFFSTCKNGTKFHDRDDLHCKPIQEMGNYQEYLKKQTPPLREIDATPTRLHAFGNPFKVKQNLIDEADEAILSAASETFGRKRTFSESSSTSSNSSPMQLSSPSPFKRKQCPLPRNVPSRYFLSPSSALSTLPPHLGEGSQLSLTSSSSPLMGKPKDQALSETSDTAPVKAVDSSEHLSVDGRVEGLSKSATTAEVLKQNTEADVEHNGKIRTTALKEVRKPGKNLLTLLGLLKSLKGSPQSQGQVLERVALEAARFKRTTMVTAIQELKTCVDLRSTMTVIWGVLFEINDDFQPTILSRSNWIITNILFM